MAVVTEPFEPVEDLGTEALRAYQQTGMTPAQLQARVAELEGALRRILPWIPTSTALDGGAAAFSENVRAADEVRRVLGVSRA